MANTNYHSDCVCRLVEIRTIRQGNGLSYDIVKAHGRVPIGIGMKVETKEGVRSEFIIVLP